MSASRKITTFRLAPRFKDLLLNRGIRTLDDLNLEDGPIALSRELGCAPKEAQSIIATIKLDLSEGYTVQDALFDEEASVHASESAPDPSQAEDGRSGGTSSQFLEALSSQSLYSSQAPGTGVLSQGRSALDILLEQHACCPIITFSESLDRLLGGGVETKKITEFVGVPGIGKTQLGIQLAIDCQFPKVFGGAEAKCIYIDTEGSVMPARVAEIAQAAVEHLQSVADTDEKVEAMNYFTVETILSGIEYYRVHDYIEQVALVLQLPQIIAERQAADPNSRVGLIVIDSIAFHFRTASDMAQRTRLLTSMANQLMNLAVKHDLAVVLTNQVTTRQGAGIIPALGETWSHNATVRVQLERATDSNMSRRAKLIKSNSREPGVAFYEISPDGVR